MKSRFFLAGVITIEFLLRSSLQAGAEVSAGDGNSRKRIAGIRIPFVRNQGQVDQRIAYYAQTLGGAVSVTQRGGILYSVHGPAKGGPANRLLLRESLAGATMRKPEGDEQAATKIHIFRGADRSKWKRNVPAYDSVRLGEAWRGVEVNLRANGRSVEKIFRVRPGANPDRIRIRVNGGKTLKVDSTGALEVQTELGPVQFTPPLAYQEVGHTRSPVEVAYAVKGNEYRFRVGKYDRTKELVIDPILAATYLGGGSDDGIGGLVIDATGNLYAAGGTFSADFPGIGGASLDATLVGAEAFVARLTPDLGSFLAVTYLGGSGFDQADEIALGPAGEVFIAGRTSSADFPGVGPGSADSLLAGVEDGFVAKLSPGLETLLGATLLGGSDVFDQPHALAVDSSGSPLVGGSTLSADFPGIGVTSADATQSGFEGFLAKLSPDLTTFLGATYLGGNTFDHVLAVAFGGNGDVYAAGGTGSADFPGIGPGSADPTLDVSEAFVARLTPDLQTIVVSTYLGGSGGEDANAIVFGSLGNLYVTGGTQSSDFPGVTPGPPVADHDAFVALLTPDLGSVLAAILAGGSGFDDPHAIALDGQGRVFLTGEAFQSPDFPGVGPGSADSVFLDVDVPPGFPEEAFVVRLSPDLTEIQRATFLGGFKGEIGTAIAVGPTGDVFVAGVTGSPDFPGIGTASVDGSLTDPLGDPADLTEGFIARLDPDLSDNPPDCSAAFPSVTRLWPPNHNLESVEIHGVTDPEGDPVTITIQAIFQDEPVNASGDGDLCPDATGVGASAAQLRAERTGTGDGRVYHVHFIASDGDGPGCSGVVTVRVPHAQDEACGDQGELFDSTACPP